jgi:hypothetical protein
MSRKSSGSSAHVIGLGLCAFAIYAGTHGIGLSHESHGSAYSLARSAGFSATEARTMAAIARPESGLCTHARGDVGLQTATWGPSIGLWQVRSRKADYGTGRPRDASRLTDPAFNAASARSIYLSQGYGAWTTHGSPGYYAALGKPSPTHRTC